MSKNKKKDESPYQINQNYSVAESSKVQKKILKHSRKTSRKAQDSDKANKQKKIEIIVLDTKKSSNGNKGLKHQSYSAKRDLVLNSDGEHDSPAIKNKPSSLAKQSEKPHHTYKKGQQFNFDNFSLPKNLSQARTDKKITQKLNIQERDSNNNLSPLQLNNKQKIRMHLVSLIKPPKMKTVDERQKDYVLEGSKDKNIFQNVNIPTKQIKGRKSSFNEQYNRFDYIKKRQTKQQMQTHQKIQTQLYQQSKQRQFQLVLKRQSQKDLEKLEKFNDVQINYPLVNFSSTKKSKMILPSIEKQKEREKSHTYEGNSGKSNENKIHIFKPNNLTDVVLTQNHANHHPSINHKKYYAAVSTRAGSNARGQKKNQDTSIIQNTMPLGVKFYCICDGHGVNGHFVSDYIKQILPKNLTMLLKKYSNSIAFSNLNNMSNKENQEQKIIQIFKEAFQKTNSSLLSSDINTELSGSTVVGVFIYKDTIFCLNVGDSRAILGSIKQEEQRILFYSKNQSTYLQTHFQIVRSPFLKRVWKSKALSLDQTPQRQDQRRRINSHGGGVIKRQKDERGNQIGPERVWKKDMGYPGLAMTRSFGDKAGIKAGTNAQPEIICHKLTKDDKIIVVASDGVWQYLSNSKVIEICGQLYQKQVNLNQFDELQDSNRLERVSKKQIQKESQIMKTVQICTQKIVKESFEQWQKLCYTRDDITAIVIMIRHPNYHNQVSDKRVASSLLNQSKG